MNADGDDAVATTEETVLKVYPASLRNYSLGADATSRRRDVSAATARREHRRVRAVLRG